MNEFPVITWKDITPYQRGEKRLGAPPRNVACNVGGIAILVKQLTEPTEEEAKYGYVVEFPGQRQTYFDDNLEEAKRTALVILEQWLLERHSFLHGYLYPEDAVHSAEHCEVKDCDLCADLLDEFLKQHERLEDVRDS